MPPNVLSNPWLWLLGLLITSGFLQYIVGAVRDYLKRRREAPPPPAPRQAEIDQSLLTMSKANAQLDEDNERLRASNKELAEMLSEERAERAREREAYQREIQALERRLREMSTEIASLLQQVGNLRQKHNTGDIPTIGSGESRRDRGDKTYEIRED